MNDQDSNFPRFAPYLQEKSFPHYTLLYRMLFGFDFEPSLQLFPAETYNKAHTTSKIPLLFPLER